MAGVRRLLVLLLGLALLSAPAAAAGATRDPGPRAVLAFFPRTVQKYYDPNVPRVLDRLDQRSQLALGLVSATQGSYSQSQALIDLTSGTRVSQATYSPESPPQLVFSPVGLGRGVVFQWGLALERAQSAPADIHPGLLAGSIPGGAGYAGLAKAKDRSEATAAAGPDGVVPAVSLGPGRTLAARTQRLLRDHRFVVVSLPQARRGGKVLDQLLAHRPDDELLMVMQTPPTASLPQLLPMGVAGLRGGAGSLTSETTHREGIVGLIDVLPTVLHHLGLPVSSDVRGEPMVVSGARDADALDTTVDRLSRISSRRMIALNAFVFVWVALLLALGLLRDRRGLLLAMRLGGLALLWLPSALLVTSLLRPSRTAEIAIIVGLSFIMAALVDRFVPWPRGPAVPAFTALIAYGVCLAADSRVLVGSLLGPNPRLGSRFYGIGNELEISLTLLFLVGVAAAIPWRERSKRVAGVFAGVGLLTAVWLTAGRLGADVGAVFTTGSALAAVVLLLLPGGVTRRAVVLAVAVPVALLALLAVLDTVTGGEGHFTRTVLHAHGAGDLEQTFYRRVELAFNNLTQGLAPLTTGIALLAAGYAVRHRARVYAALEGDPVWRAALGAGLIASIVGALTNDSGPLLLIIGVAGLAALTAYLRARPLGPDEVTPEPPRESAATGPPSATPVAG
jgi:hypothetical protein